MRVYLLLALLSLSALVARPQQMFEYGRAAEMRGLTKFFLDTDGDMKRREQITEIIRKKLPMLTFTERAEDAQALILYTEEMSSRFVKGTSVDDRSCVAKVVVPLGGDNARLLFSYNMKKKNIFQKDPYKNFAAEFIKAYKEANVDVSNNPYYRQMTGQDKKPE